VSSEPDDDQPDLGSIIRAQRELAELSTRRLARMAGISNPYLSQIERGLRVPSNEVLAAIADSLQLSADLFRAQVGRDRTAVVEAVEADSGLTFEQKRALVEAYRSMTVANGRRGRRGSHRSRSSAIPDDH